MSPAHASTQERKCTRASINVLINDDDDEDDDNDEAEGRIRRKSERTRTVKKKDVKAFCTKPDMNKTGAR